MIYATIHNIINTIAYFYAACLVFSIILLCWGCASLAHDFLRYGRSVKPPSR